MKKIKKLKVNVRTKEIYSFLKNHNINVTDEIIILVDILNKEISEFIEPSILFETYDIKDQKVNYLLKSLSVPKNAENITVFICSLNNKIDSFLSSITEKIKILITEAIIEEYLNSSITTVCKILQDQNKDTLEIGSIFLLPEEIHSDVAKLLEAEKINLNLSNKNYLKYTSFNYVFWLKKK